MLRSADARELVDSSRSASLLVIDGEAIFDIDFTGVEALTSLVTEMRTSDVEVKLARFHQTVYEALDRGGLIETLGEGSFYVTPEEALPTID